MLAMWNSFPLQRFASVYIYICFLPPFSLWCICYGTYPLLSLLRPSLPPSKKCVFSWNSVPIQILVLSLRFPENDRCWINTVACRSYCVALLSLLCLSLPLPDTDGCDQITQPTVYLFKDFIMYHKKPLLLLFSFLGKKENNGRCTLCWRSQWHIYWPLHKIKQQWIGMFLEDWLWFSWRTYDLHAKYSI